MRNVPIMLQCKGDFATILPPIFPKIASEKVSSFQTKKFRINNLPGCCAARAEFVDHEEHRKTLKTKLYSNFCNALHGQHILRVLHNNQVNCSLLTFEQLHFREKKFILSSKLFEVMFLIRSFKIKTNCRKSVVY